MPWFKRPAQYTGVHPLDSKRIEKLHSRRRHLTNAPYLLPKDIEDQNRLDLQHYLLRQALRGNYLAPIENPQRILDVACGTGRWCAEMAHEFPSASITGFDIEPPLLSSSSIRMGAEHSPRNCAFVQGDMTHRLPFQDQTFDFIHMRLVFAALPQNQWLPLARECAWVTKPGGWVELVDTRGIHRPLLTSKTASAPLYPCKRNRCAPNQ